MYENLVAEYLDYQLPELVERPSCWLDLPSPRQRNLIQSIIGVRRCGKTFALFQNILRLMREGIPRNLLFFFPFDDERLDHDSKDLGSQVLDTYLQLVPQAEEGCYLFFR